jgi:hypothetical protein
MAHAVLFSSASTVWYLGGAIYSLGISQDSHQYGHSIFCQLLTAEATHTLK